MTHLKGRGVNIIDFSMINTLLPALLELLRTVKTMTSVTSQTS